MTLSQGKLDQADSLADIKMQMNAEGQVSLLKYTSMHMNL